MMKKILKIFIVSIALLSAVHGVKAQVNNELWKVLSNTLQPVINAYRLKVPSLGSSGNPCISVDTTGLFATTTCGSGSGGGSISTSTPIANTQVIYATGVATIGSEAAFTYNSATDVLRSVNASSTNASSTNLTAGTLYSSTLTSGRVPYLTTAGRFIDNSALTFNGNIFTAPSFRSSNQDGGSCNGGAPVISDTSGNFYTDGTTKYFCSGVLHIDNGFEMNSDSSIYFDAEGDHFSRIINDHANQFTNGVDTMNLLSINGFAFAQGEDQSSGTTVAIPGGLLNINNTYNLQGGGLNGKGKFYWDTSPQGADDNAFIIYDGENARNAIRVSNNDGTVVINEAGGYTAIGKTFPDAPFNVSGFSHFDSPIGLGINPTGPVWLQIKDTSGTSPNLISLTNNVGAGDKTWTAGITSGGSLIWTPSNTNAAMSIDFSDVTKYFQVDNTGVLVGPSSSFKFGQAGVFTRMSSLALGQQMQIDNGTSGQWRDLVVRNLSMGTTSTSTTLTIQGTAGKNPFGVATSTGPNMLILLQNNNFGIGSSTPAHRLTVEGSAWISGNATTTNVTATGTLVVLGKSTLANASTTNETISGFFNLSGLTGPAFLAIDNNKNVITTTTPSGGAGSVTAVTGTYPVISSGGTTPNISLAFGTTTSNIWAGLQTFSNATTSNLTVTGNSYLGTVLSGTWNGTPIGNSFLANSTISGVALGGTLNALTATNGTLTFSGSYDGSAARTVGLNLANANTWSANQTFGNSSTTNASISGFLSVIGQSTFGNASSTNGSYSGFLNVTGSTTAQAFIKSGGTSAQFLKADGSIDSNTYITSGSAVTSVTGTYPIISSGGATPAISIAFGTTTSNTWAGTQTFGTLVTTAPITVGQPTSGTFSDFVGNIGNTNGNCTGIRFGIGTGGQYIKSGIVQIQRGDGNNIGDVAIINNNTANSTNGGCTDAKWFFKGDGKTGFSTSTPSTVLDVLGGIYSELVTPATSTTMTLDFTGGNNQKIVVGTANITVNITNASSAMGKCNIIYVVAPASGVIGSTTFSGSTGSGAVVWNGNVNPGNSIVNGSTDTFSLCSMASSTPFIGASLIGTY